MEQQGEQAEAPECPVCLTSYDVVSTIPRVIPCGHTTCEACLLLLPHPFPNTIRCPSCTQLVNFPKHPSSFPKNIDLLRFSPQSTSPEKLISQPLHQEGNAGYFIPNLWSHEFYQNWIKWVVPNDVVVKGSNSENDDIKVGSLNENCVKGSDIDDHGIKAGSLSENCVMVSNSDIKAGSLEKNCVKGSDIDDHGIKAGSLIEPIYDNGNWGKGSDIDDHDIKAGSLDGNCVKVSDIDDDDIKAGSLIEPIYDRTCVEGSDNNAHVINAGSVIEPIYDHGNCVKGSDIDDGDNDIKVGSSIEPIYGYGNCDNLVEKEETKEGFVKECDGDGVVERCCERGEFDEDSVGLDDQSSNVEGNEGMVAKSCPSDYGGIGGRSFEKEYFDGKIVKGDQSVLRDYGKCLFVGMLRDDDKVGLVKVGCMSEGNKENKLKYHYEAKVMNFLYGMGSDDELGLLLNTSLRLHRTGKVYGFWGNNDDDCVYMVCERFTSCLVEKLQCFKRGLKEMVDFVMVGAEMCQIVHDLHSESLVVGCLSASCFGFDNFGRASFDFGNVLVTGRRVCRLVSDSISNKVGIAGENLRLRDYLLDSGVFVSPELLSKLTGNEAYSEFEICCGSDVWSLACLLIWLLTGKSFAEEMYNYYSILLCESRNGKEDVLALYMGWMTKVTALLDKRLDTKFVVLKKMLCKCLEFDPIKRPSLNELWRCIKQLVKTEIDVTGSFIRRVPESIKYCIALGELCQLGKEIEKSDVDISVEHERSSITDKDIGEGVSKGKVKCIDLVGHMDCITALTVGGGFLFSASYDKTVNVWSLHDFTHVLSLKGHEHRVMAVVYVDETSLCISGDNGGAICIWDAKAPFSSEPIKKLNEQKDWRYSGIHAMAVSGAQYFYTGSGDKTVKAWALHDYTLICVMSGHKSVVSSLAVNNGVLYSGSWDGTVRLWCISDHSPLAVIGEDTSNNISSVLTLAADDNFVFVGHEDGRVRIWQNDKLLMTKKAHNGAILAVLKKERFLFAGGWDKTISVHQVSGCGVESDIRLVGDVSSESTITDLAYWHGKLFAGQADRVIKVYYSSL